LAKNPCESLVTLVLSSADDVFGPRLPNSLEQALEVKIGFVLYSLPKSDFGIEKDEVPESPAL